MTTAHQAKFMIYDTLLPGHEYMVLSLPPISAWALLFGGKDVENRSWSTTQRGRILIHASNESMSLRERHWRRAEVSFLSGLAPSALPLIFVRRAILGSVELVDCLDDARSKWAVPGKYHWVVREPRPLRAPIEDVEGELQQLWRWTYEQEPLALAERRRAPSRSGIVPAVRAPGAEPSRGAAARTVTRRRSS